MTGVALRNVSLSYPVGKDRRQEVIEAFSLTIQDSEFVTIIGPNGCGKSSLLNLVAGLVRPDSGAVEISLGDMTRPQIGYIWQDYRSMLLPWFNVADNITFPLRIAGHSRAVRLSKARELLHQVGDQLGPLQKTFALSGGQKQLVNLLRCFALKPDLLLLDEPFSALDQFNRWSMAFTLESIWLKHRIPVVFVSHDIDEAIMLADRIILMSNKPSKIEEIILNQMPRPRSVNMLFSERHIEYRTRVIEFLSRQGAIRNQGASSGEGR